MNRSAIYLTDDELSLRFPRGDFTHTRIEGLVASRNGSDAGRVKVWPWSPEERSRWAIEKARFDRSGYRIAWVIRKAGRSPLGNGLVQALARRRGIPLVDPPKSTAAVSHSRFDLAGWLEPEQPTAIRLGAI